MAMETGQKAPALELTAAVSGRPVTPAAGAPQVWVFHGPKTTDAPKEVGKAVRAQFPKAEEVLVCNMVDLRSMSGLWQKVASAGIKQNYERMAAKLRDKGQEPEAYVIICPDWEGAAAKAFGFEDPNTTPAVAVLDAEGTVVAVAEGEDLPGYAVAALKEFL